MKRVLFEDKDYPANLKGIKNPPKSIYYRGKWDHKLFSNTLAIVGSRRLTKYGKTATEKLVAGLVSRKVVVISGFMYGTDTEAHQKCLEYGGRTIAVLGNGLNVLYPPENEKLYGQILDQGGLVISEYEPDLQPQLWTFPQRNRIVAGLATLGVLVIEAGEKSGSLITVRLAQNQGKKIYSVPGPITSSVSIGTNLLIRDHRAKMVLAADDILGNKPTNPTLFSRQTLSPTEKKIFQVLETEPLTADEIAVLTNQNIIKIGKALSLMALKGLISDAAGKYYLNS